MVDSHRNVQSFAIPTRELLLGSDWHWWVRLSPWPEFFRAIFHQLGRQFL
jgi:hypothetical protein